MNMNGWSKKNLKNKRTLNLLQNPFVKRLHFSHEKENKLLIGTGSS